MTTNLYTTADDFLPMTSMLYVYLPSHHLSSMMLNLLSDNVSLKRCLEGVLPSS